jgi:sugar phosphate permease
MARTAGGARRILTATNIVLALLCAMYFITYIDRVNIATAGTTIKNELKLSNTELGFVFSAFGYSYAVMQVFGGWVGDKLGPRITLALCGVVWAGTTMATGLAGGLVSLVLMRLLLGLGEGATFPTSTRAMSNWFPANKRAFAQGITHSFARLGNAVTPWIVLQLILAISWRGSFVVLGLLSLLWGIAWFWYFRDDPRGHQGVTEREISSLPAFRHGRGAEAERVPWGKLVPRMLPTTIVYFCYGWSLWLYLNWLPSFFQQGYKLNLKDTVWFSVGVFAAGVVGDTAGGLLSDWLLRKTGSLKVARRNLVVASLLGSLVFLVPVLLYRDLTVIALCLSGAFFCLEMTIGPIWAVPMDIAPRFSGTASGLMNTGSAVAAIVSPQIFGWLVDLTGDWHLPFAGSIALLLLGAVLAFWMHPERPLAEAALSAEG